MLLNIDIYMFLSIVFFLFGLFFFYLILQQKRKINTLIEAHTSLETQVDYFKEDIKNSSLKYAVLNTRYEEEIKSSSEKLAVLQNAKDELSREFKLLANQIFEDKSKQFSHTHKE